MKRIIKSVTVFVALWVGVGASRSLLAAVDVKLHERIAPSSSVVRLGDVAEVTAADRDLARQLASMPLMPAPSRGTERFLRTREIQDMLAAQGADLGTLHFCGADQVAIAAADRAEFLPNKNQSGDAINRPRNLHAAILAGATSEVPAKAPQLNEAQAKAFRDRLNGMIGNYLNSKSGRVMAWQVECEAEDRQIAQLSAATSPLVCRGGSDPWTGRQRFLISFSTADGPVQLPIVANVSPPPVPAVFAVRAIARGDVIRAADIELRTMGSLSKASGQRPVADSVEKLIGFEARQQIQAGDVVFIDAVQPPILVKRGDMVTVTSQSGGIRVRTSAHALHDGAHGELVQVESIGAREKFDARVVGSREVAVFAMSRPAESQAEKPLMTAQRQVFSARQRDGRDQ